MRGDSSGQVLLRVDQGGRKNGPSGRQHFGDHLSILFPRRRSIFPHSLNMFRRVAGRGGALELFLGVCRGPLLEPDFPGTAAGYTSAPLVESALTGAVSYPTSGVEACSDGLRDADEHNVNDVRIPQRMHTVTRIVDTRAEQSSAA